MRGAGSSRRNRADQNAADDRERTLANGLRVLSVVDKSSPSVAINVWYHVGSKDDPTSAAALRICSSTSCSNQRRT
jgi:predicted Zn-dependent peptidase